MEPNTDNNSKWIIVLLVSVLLVVGVIAGISMKKEKKVVIPKQPASTSLFFSPSEQTVSKGEVIKVAVYMNTGIASVNGVDLKLVYDPNIFEVVEFTKETSLQGFAQEIKNEIDNTAGVFRYSAFSFDPELFLNGANLALYTLDVKVNANAPAAEYTFDFDQGSSISASKAGQNMFSGSTPQKITIR